MKSRPSKRITSPTVIFRGSERTTSVASGSRGGPEAAADERP